MQDGTTLRNNYRLDRLIGRGGMADVYVAFDMRRQTNVAVKVLRDDLAEDPEFVRRFVREAEALARLEHPNIVRFYSFERQGAIAFIVMDLVVGSTLQRRLAENEGPLPLDEITNIFAQVASALAYAHHQGYIHRDIKPGNVMLRVDGNALLSDFGIARAAESATLATIAMGTPAYMSPEQILGHELDRRADIYSLGVVLYEMTTGRRPFTGDERGITGTSTLARLREAHLKVTPPDPRSFVSSLPAGAAEVILRALAKDPADRWPDVLSMVRAWETAVGKPVAAALSGAGMGLPTPAWSTPARLTPPGAGPAPTPGAGAYTPPGGAYGRAGVTPAEGFAPATPPAVVALKRQRPIWAYVGGAGVLGLVILALVVWRLVAGTLPEPKRPTPIAIAQPAVTTPSPTALPLPTSTLRATSASAAAASTVIMSAATSEPSATPNLQATIETLVKGTVTAAAQITLAVALPAPTETPTSVVQPSSTPRSATPTPAPTVAPSATFTWTPPPPTSTTAPTPTTAPTRATSSCPAWFQRPQPGKGILLIENHIGKTLRVERMNSQETWTLPAKQGDTPGRLLLQLTPGRHEFMDYPEGGEGHIVVTIQAGEMWVSPIWFNDSREEKIFPLQAPPGC